jgi:hypothetical protein
VGCTSNSDCPITEACVNQVCQRPCDLHNPCAQNGVCINTNHGTDCSCTEGYHGNAYVGCLPGITKEILKLKNIVLNTFYIIIFS